jgi:hypothetical protein
MPGTIASEDAKTTMTEAYKSNLNAPYAQGAAR